MSSMHGDVTPNQTSYFLNRDRPVEDGDEELAGSLFTHDLQLETAFIPERNHPFLRLLGGKESLEATQLRWSLYSQACEYQQSRIQQLLTSENARVLDDIAQFVRAPWHNDVDAKISTAILLPGSNIANHLRLFTQIYKRIEQQQTSFLLSLASKECPNLKMALKKIVAKITEDQEAAVELEDGDIRFDRRLRYDLDILADWCRKQVKSNDQISTLEDIRIVVSIEDADSFDVSILSRLIKMMQSYISKIPFKLILSVATSLEVFQGKLSRSCIRQMQGVSFHAEIKHGVSKALEVTMFTFNPQSLLLGPKLFSTLVDRQTQSMESIDAFTSSLKYVYMSHYYSNPFVVLVKSREWTGDPEEIGVNQLLSPEHFKALRLLNSFRRYVERMATEGNYGIVKLLLADDGHLLAAVSNAVQEFRLYVILLNTILEVLMLLQVGLHFETILSKLELYPLVIMGALGNDPMVEELLEKTANADPATVTALVTSIQNLPVDPMAHGFLMSLCSGLQAGDPGTLRSLLLDPISVAYKDKFLYEIFVPDSASLQDNVFLPTYRAALEMALSYPSHYWGKTAQEPHISILYQLYRESSVFINIYDYYTAFKEQCRRPDTVTEDAEWNKMTLAWFLQGIAELKLIGILRDSKRKFECVEKIAWKDL